MTTAPPLLDGATVLMFADISGAFPTAGTRHVVQGDEVHDLEGLAITRYRTGSGFYLFYCDDDWNVVTDTYHETIDAAMRQAEFEFGPVEFVDRQGLSTT